MWVDELVDSIESLLNRRIRCVLCVSCRILNSIFVSGKVCGTLARATIPSAKLHINARMFWAFARCCTLIQLAKTNTSFYKQCSRGATVRHVSECTRCCHKIFSLFFAKFRYSKPQRRGVFAQTLGLQSRSYLRRMRAAGCKYANKATNFIKAVALSYFGASAMLPTIMPP